VTARSLKDLLARNALHVVCVSVPCLVLLLAAGLYLRARPVLGLRSLGGLIFSSAWRPSGGEFGMGGFIAGSLLVTALAMFIAVPLGLLTAIYLAEYAPARIKETYRPVVDVLAGISPVIYGVWGVLVVVPFVRGFVMPFAARFLPFFPFVSDNYTGYSALAAGIVLAIMVLPVLISVGVEVMEAVPLELREASLALSATRWQTVRRVVLRRARTGIIAAVILSLSRAFGETFAVLMVAGCSLRGVPRSVFDPAYPLPALIANTYGEMMSVELYDSAVMAAALVLFAVAFAFNALAWGVLLRVQRRWA